MTMSWANRTIAVAVLFLAAMATLPAIAAGPLDPRGKIHIPIGVANTLDTLKTFVEAEGTFSPGVGSYGIYFWVFDRNSGKLLAPTMDGVKVERGLRRGYLIPWVRWRADDLLVTSELCQVQRDSPKGLAQVVAARLVLANCGTQPCRFSLYAALRPLGPAGWQVRNLAVSDRGDALLVDGHPAVVAAEKPSAAGVLATDTIALEALRGALPQQQSATSATGGCSGALRFDLELPPRPQNPPHNGLGQSSVPGSEAPASEPAKEKAQKSLHLVCPVLPGRRAVGHQWDGKSTWAQFDLAELNPAEGGLLQPDPGLDYYRNLSVERLFAEAEAYWQGLAGRATIRTPDPRWAEMMAAIIGHVAVSMNEGAPDVAVVNYNVFNRDGVYVANILQKSGNFALAREAIDYFLSHPFNGRVYPEADNPGQILWIMGEHWRLTRDGQWLKRVYPAVQKLAALVRYYRTTPGPHWVSMTSLGFGESLPPQRRKQLQPGSCDGHHPEYTEAFDIAGLRAAVLLAEAAGETKDAAAWKQTADTLFQGYDRQFGNRLPNGYGSYSVLWPCRLYAFGEGKAYEQFKDVGMKKPGGWRYFPLAAAHQGLLAGNRQSGYATLDAHLAHEQMQGWYVFDEGGASGAGGWLRLRTTWNHGVAMPHGWAIAEMWLLMRDCLLHEDGDRLVLLAGVAPQWLTGSKPVAVEQMPTHFGPCSLSYEPSARGAVLKLTGKASPPGGYVLRLPAGLAAKVAIEGKVISPSANGDLLLPAGTKEVRLTFGVRP